ncbi:MAG TPA: histidine phosphatase family protein [Ilumatobacteraceae bacterium]|nr:histidine phosphatase family protein [Ilumatobacteraceae bacterium]
MLILLRHGRTALNAAGVLQGRVDQPLDEVGRAQASQVAAALGPADLVITSSLQRARETAGYFGRETVVDDRWIEIDYGRMEGQPVSVLSSPEWVRVRMDPAVPFDGGESLAAVAARVDPAFADALELARDRTVVVVSHVSPIKAAIGVTLGCDHPIGFRCHLDHASVSRVESRSTGPVLRSFNEVLYHISPEPRPEVVRS